MVPVQPPRVIMLRKKVVRKRICCATPMPARLKAHRKPESEDEDEEEEGDGSESLGSLNQWQRKNWDEVPDRVEPLASAASIHDRHAARFARAAMAEASAMNEKPLTLEPATPEPPLASETKPRSVGDGARSSNPGSGIAKLKRSVHRVQVTNTAKRAFAGTSTLTSDEISSFASTLVDAMKKPAPLRSLRRVATCR